MCSIIGSFSKEMIKSLVLLNQHRGNFSYSIAAYDIHQHEVVDLKKDFDVFDFNVLDSMTESSNIYYICHLQAPTGGLLKEIERIHPTHIDDTYMWHNGIITPAGMRFLNELNSREDSFDTYALHNYLYNNNDLSKVEGLFTCCYVDFNVYVFRTKHGKLYVDDNLNLSSERFEGSKCINYDTIYNLDFINKTLQYADEFKTLNYNYIIKGELDA